AAGGESCLAVMAGGKFGGLSWILPLVLLQLTVGSHVVLLQLLLNSIEESQNLIRATIVALPVMVAAMALAAHFSPIALLYTPLLFSVCMNSYIVWRLNRRKFSYHPDWKMMGGIVLAAAVAFVPGRVLAGSWSSGLPIATLAIVCLLVTMLYLLLLVILKVVRKSELSMVKSLLVNK